VLTLSHFLQVFVLEKELNDLVAGVKSGRHEDFELIKIRYRPLMRDLAKSFEQSGAGTLDDLLEESQRALLKACVSFDETKKGITFGLYAKICIRNALISLMRSKKTKRKRMGRSVGKAERKIPKLEGFEGLEAEEIVERIAGSLSQYEQRVFFEFFSGRSASEVAAILGSDEKSVYNAVYRIRSKAKKLSDDVQK